MLNGALLFDTEPFQGGEFVPVNALSLLNEPSYSPSFAAHSPQFGFSPVSSPVSGTPSAFMLPPTEYCDPPESSTETTRKQFEELNVTEEGHYPCSHCEKVFTKQFALKSHQLVHNGTQSLPRSKTKPMSFL